MPLAQQSMASTSLPEDGLARPATAPAGATPGMAAPPPPVGGAASPGDALPAPGSAAPGLGEIPGLEGEEINAQALDAFMQIADEIVYDENGDVQPVFMQALANAQGPDPTLVLAKTSADTTTRIVTALVEKQVGADGAVAMAGLMEMTGEFATVSEGEGIYSYSQPEIDKAFARGSEILYNETSPMGLFPPEEMAADGEVLQQVASDGTMEGLLQELGVQEGYE